MYLRIFIGIWKMEIGCPPSASVLYSTRTGKGFRTGCLRKLIDSAPDSRSRALALSSSIQHAGDWLSVIPSRALGLHMLDQEFRVCLHYWLGIRLFSEGLCTQCNRHNIDPFGDHHLSCLGHGEKITRHDTLRDVIFSAARLVVRRGLTIRVCGIVGGH